MSASAVRRKVDKFIAQHGATIAREKTGKKDNPHSRYLPDDDEECFYLRIEAPPGKKWAAIGCHGMVEASEVSWDDVYRLALDTIGYGLEDCTDPDCDCCDEAGLR